MAKSESAVETETQVPLLYALSIIFIVLSTTSVALRLYTRSRILGIVGPDDITITVAVVLAIAVSVATILQAIWGLGRHMEFVPQEDALNQLRVLYANIMIYNAAQILTKISFLIQYRRLFPSQNIQRVCFWLLIFIITWGVTQEFLIGFSCTPLTVIMPGMMNKCIYTLPIWYLTSSMNILTDFMIFIVPIVPVLRLQIGKKQKYLLIALFGLGFFTCIISLIRISTLHKAVNTHDPNWDNAPAAYWSVVELNCGILCASLPTLRPLIHRVVPHLLTTKGHVSNSDSSESHQMGSTHHKKTRPDIEEGMDGIYIQKEVELHSTTELRSNAAKYSNSIDEPAGSMNATITGEVTAQKVENY